VVNEKDENFTEKDDVEKLSLIEIGPRFCLMPIKAFQGSMGGEALWQNSEYIAPSKVRSKKYDAFVKRREGKEKRKEYSEQLKKGQKEEYNAFEDEE